MCSTCRTGVVPAASLYDTSRWGRGVPSAAASCCQLYGWGAARGVGAGRGRRGIPTTFSETQSTLHSHHTTYAFVLYVPTTFFFLRTWSTPQRVRIRIHARWVADRSLGSGHDRCFPHCGNQSLALIQPYTHEAFCFKKLSALYCRHVCAYFGAVCVWCLMAG